MHLRDKTTEKLVNEFAFQITLHKINSNQTTTQRNSTNNKDKMKFQLSAIAIVMTASVSNGFINPNSFGLSRQSSSLSMVLEKPREKKLAKVEVLKTQSRHLTQPLMDVSANQVFCEICYKLDSL